MLFLHFEFYDMTLRKLNILEIYAWAVRIDVTHHVTIIWSSMIEYLYVECLPYAVRPIHVVVKYVEEMQ